MGFWLDVLEGDFDSVWLVWFIEVVLFVKLMTTDFLVSHNSDGLHVRSDVIDS